MFTPKVKISGELLKKLKEAAEVMGCASVNELVESLLSAEAERILSQNSSRNASAKEVADITNKLKGLGYLE